MLSFQFLTLVLAAATAATPAPSDPSASLGDTEMESIIPYQDYEAQMASAEADGMRARGEERICDLTLCTGVNLSGDCSRWCYYRSRPQLVPTSQRLGTRSAWYEIPIECWFY
ncbi:hypothetical protein LZ30DRAFT_557492, partial [Colletotrichum cereale]